MTFYHFFMSGLAATSFMTLFSYAISFATGKNFKEPYNLALLTQRLFPNLKSFWCNVVGWFLHYLVGYLFIAIYILVWHNTIIKTTAANGIWLGALAGVVGIIIWHITLKLHPNPPYIDKPPYYTQLVIAHVIFGVTGTLGYL